MLAKIASFAVFGVDAFAVEVEVHISSGKDVFNTVGLPDAAVKESKDRVKAALINSGYYYPRDHITVNLAPADMRKEGPSLDLPIAVGLLAALEKVDRTRLHDHALVGELGLDGRVKPVAGALPLALGARAAGRRALLLPAENAPEAAVVDGLEVLPVETLQQAVEYLNCGTSLEPLVVNPAEVFAQTAHHAVDFSEVRGQDHAKRALEVAAAGGHNVLLL